MSYDPRDLSGSKRDALLEEQVRTLVDGLMDYREDPAIPLEPERKEEIVAEMVAEFKKWRG